MSRKVNFINNLLCMALTAAGLIAVVLVANAHYATGMGVMLLYFAAGAIIAGFICTVFHETGHLIAGKINGFAFLSLTIWFFKFSRERNKTVFDFTFMGEEAGYTEMAAKSVENLPVKLKKYTLGGLIATIIPMLCGVAPLFIAGRLPVFLFVAWAMLLPLGAYTFFGNALPMSSGGAGNDGKILYGLKIMDDDTKVILSMLAVQSELYNGKTPAEIDEKYYTDVPQLAEDDLNFIMLLTARLAYYIDKKDYANARKVNERCLTVAEYAPKSIERKIKTDALYAACTFQKDEDAADDLMGELEKYLNRHNGSAEIRAKLAYVLYVTGEKNALDAFYQKGVKEANRLGLRGQGVYERKLLEKMKADF